MVGASRLAVMLRPAAALALFIAASSARTVLAQPREDARAVTHAATRAVQGDSAASLRDRWSARLQRDSSDRAAVLGLATLARLEYDYPTADRLYRRLIADSLRVDGYSAVARLGLARQLEGRGFSVEARPHFHRARAEARTAGDRATEAEILLVLAFIRARTEGVGVGEALLDTARGLIPDSAFTLRSQLHWRRAIMLSLRGRDDAVVQAESSIVLAGRGGDPRIEADAYRALGQVLVYRQQHDSALIMLRRGEALLVRARDRSALAAQLVWRAQALGNLGRYGEMRDVMRRALAEGETSHNPAAVAVAHRSLGALAIMLGDYASADAHLRRSVEISRGTGDSLGVKTTRKFLADVALSTGDVSGARRLAQEQLAIARTTGDSRDEYEAHVMLAELAMRERDWPSAERDLHAARGVLPRLPGADTRIWLLHHEARLAQARGDLVAAERAFAAFLRELGGEPIAAEAGFDTHVRLADLHAARGDATRAERELTSASDALDRWRATLGDAELRVLAFQVSPSQHARAADPTEQHARVARVLGVLAAAGRGNAAFALAERRRARELTDRLAAASALRADTARTPSATASARAGSASITATEIAALIPDERTAVLEFVGGAGGSPLTVFVVRRGGLRARVLVGTDSLAERIARFAGLIEAGDTATELARSLGATLIEPAITDVASDVQRLIIVPDGPLYYLPWDALRLADGRFLAERYAVSIAPSAGVLAALWRRVEGARAADGRVRLLAFGDPVFPRADAGEEDAEPPRIGDDPGARAAPAELPRLRASADEVRRVARYAHDVKMLLRDEASAAFLKHASLREYDIIHFATHALVDDRSVARTALVLAPGDGESGFVGGGDLAALTLDADLVVLSACRTARGALVEGEGVQGLTAPLLEAGARAIVATGWRVGDRSTGRFVDDFYRALASGHPASDALRAAKMEAIRRGAAPVEWAAFMLVGDPMVTVALRERGRESRAMWWLAAVAVLLAAAVAGVRVMRSRT